MNENIGHNNESPKQFHEMLFIFCFDLRMTQKQVARELGISTPYLNDLLHQKRLPSVAVVEKICMYLGCGVLRRRVWMLAGAQAHGWEV